MGHRVFTPSLGRAAVAGMATYQTKHRRFAPGVSARVEERVCAMLFQETILQRLGKALHAHWDDIARAAASSLDRADPAPE